MYYNTNMYIIILICIIITGLTHARKKLSPKFTYFVIIPDQHV